MTQPHFPLDQIQVASPCPASWADMTGDDHVRFCGACERHVYHLSNLTRQEAEDLMQETEGRVCVRFYRREDGTVLTREDCPKGLAALRQRTVKVAAMVASCLAGLFLTPMGWAQELQPCPPPQTITPSSPPPGEHIQGMIQGEMVPNPNIHPAPPPPTLLMGKPMVEPVPRPPAP